MRPRVGLADAPAKRGDLRAEAAESMVKSVRKVASADCRRARATDFSLINDRVFFEFAGGGTHPLPEISKVSGLETSKVSELEISSWSSVRSGYLPLPGRRRMEAALASAGVGIGE